MTSSTIVAGPSRPLRLRMRADLEVQRHTYLGRQYWVLKDPLGLKYYRFEDEEFAILKMLNGEASLEDVQEGFEQRFAPQKITLQELHQLVGMLHRSALVVSDAQGQGTKLLQRHVEVRRRSRLSQVANLLSLRLRGIDPDRILGWLEQRVGWFFSPVCFVCCLVLAAAALLLITTQFEVFCAKLPAFQDFFASKNWIWLALTLSATKVLHEFGHGLSCKRFGGECHEMGVMLLVLTPCLYCNVSDSWMLPSKWRRAAIGAAGMYVEMVLASVCTCLWWCTQPGLLNYLCLNVMFISSVSTLMFNANPLLRYDGYYILSDLLEIPNLRQKASTILQRKLAAWTLGLEEVPDPFLPQRRQWLFAIYTVAAAIYRWIVTAAILWFLYHVFEPYGLKVIGQIIVLASLIGLIGQPLWQLVRFICIPGRMGRVKKPRMIASLAVATAAVAGVCLIPLPHYVRCGFYVQSRGAASLYVESPGELQQIHVRPGDRVSTGQPIVTLENTDVQLEIVRLEGQRKGLETRLASLRQRAFDDEAAAAEIPEVEEAITAINEQVTRRSKDLAALQIAAPTTGVVLPPASLPQPPHDPSRLPSWYGTPFDDRNLHAFLAEGIPVCQIGDPTSVEAILAIDQGDIEFVQGDQPVEIFVEQLPGQVLRSRIEQIARLDMQDLPRSLSSKAGGDLATQYDASGRERPLTTTYQANAPLVSSGQDLLLGATGQAKIYVGQQTIATRVWRYLCQTFNFEV